MAAAISRNLQRCVAFSSARIEFGAIFDKYSRDCQMVLGVLEAHEMEWGRPIVVAVEGTQINCLRYSTQHPAFASAYASGHRLFIGRHIFFKFSQQKVWRLHVVRTSMYNFDALLQNRLISSGSKRSEQRNDVSTLDGHIRNTVLRFDQMPRIEFLTAIARAILI